jgi:hypothetical protein
MYQGVDTQPMGEVSFAVLWIVLGVDMSLWLFLSRWLAIAIVQGCTVDKTPALAH